MNSVDKYFELLGLKPGASKAALKKAFRDKAKEFHPDLNPSPDARKKFIEVDEAYDFLIDNYDRLELLRKRSSRTNKRRTTYSQSSTRQQAWDAQSRARSRKKAENYASMNFDEFMKTDQFKSVDKLHDFADYLQVGLMVLVLLVIPVFAIIFSGTQGIVISIIIAFGTVPIWAKAVTNRKIYSFNRFYTTAKYIFKSRFFVQTMVVGVNLFLALWLWMVTAIDVWTFLLPYEIAVVIGIILYHFVLPDNKSHLAGLLAQSAPILLVNLFFILNFTFSSDPQTEHYRYIQRFEGNRGTSFIYLENNVYEEAAGLRFFVEVGPMRAGNHIAMDMERGLFGIPVLKDYRFYRK